jgi:uncharacterized protein (TIGR02246 family)
MVAAVTMVILLASAAGPWLGMARGQAGAKAKATGQPPAAAADVRSEDRAAIRASLDSFVKAFESRDAKALAAHWTAEGEYQSDEGVSIQGRTAIEKAFTTFFAKTPEVKAEIHPESLRFLARDSAVGEGSVSVQRGPAVPATSAKDRTLLVREDARVPDAAGLERAELGLHVARRHELAFFHVHGAAGGSGGTGGAGDFEAHAARTRPCVLFRQRLPR